MICLYQLQFSKYVVCLPYVLLISAPVYVNFPAHYQLNRMTQLWHNSPARNSLFTRQLGPYCIELFNSGNKGKFHRSQSGPCMILGTVDKQDQHFFQIFYPRLAKNFREVRPLHYQQLDGAQQLTSPCSILQNPGLVCLTYNCAPEFMTTLMTITEGPHLTWLLVLEKTVLRKISVGGTVGGPLLMRKFPHLHLYKPNIIVGESA